LYVQLASKKTGNEIWPNVNWKGICSSSFDGKGNVLAHGFFPNNDECLGIHFDKSENWYFGESSNTPDGQTNFYTVLLHEIVHTLGIEHSANNNSIIYAYYKGDIDKLTQDNMWAIQYSLSQFRFFATTENFIKWIGFFKFRNWLK
jgi:hypothetical protein